jgi:hypothetical protein
MKLAVLINQAGPATTPLFRKLTDQKIDLTVYYCSDIGAGRYESNHDFREKIDWGAVNYEFYKHKFFFNNGRLNLKSIRDFFYEKPEVIIIYGWNNLIYWIVYIVALFKKIPIIVWGENPLDQEFLKNSFILKIKKYIFQKFFNERISLYW